MGPQPPEAEPAVKRARSVEAPVSVGRVPAQVCDLQENTLPRLPRRTEVEGEGCRERELAQGGQRRPRASLRPASRSEEAHSWLGTRRGGEERRNGRPSAGRAAHRHSER